MWVAEPRHSDPFLLLSQVSTGSCIVNRTNGTLTGARIHYPGIARGQLYLYHLWNRNRVPCSLFQPCPILPVAAIWSVNHQMEDFFFVSVFPMNEKTLDWSFQHLYHFWGCPVCFVSKLWSVCLCVSLVIFFLGNDMIWWVKGRNINRLSII